MPRVMRGPPQLYRQLVNHARSPCRVLGLATRHAARAQQRARPRLASPRARSRAQATPRTAALPHAARRRRQWQQQQQRQRRRAAQAAGDMVAKGVARARPRPCRLRGRQRIGCHGRYGLRRGRDQRGGAGARCGKGVRGRRQPNDKRASGDPQEAHGRKLSRLLQGVGGAQRRRRGRGHRLLRQGAH